MIFDKWQSIEELQAALRSGAVSAVELVKESLKRAEANKDLNIFVSLFEENAKRQAAQIDENIKARTETRPLAGIPYVAKDNYLTKGEKTTASSNILGDFISPIESTVTQSLKDAGAILIGKTNLDSFAHGSSTENSDFGPTKNPHDNTRVPGGSSGGSAAAVAANIVPFAIGSDTGGSIRQPASYCGVIGVKPSYGSVSRYGVVAMTSSTDTMGVFAMSIDDTNKVLDVITHQDKKDSTTIKLTKDSPTTKLKFGVIKQHLTDGIDSEMKNRILQIIEKLKISGYEIEEIDMPILKYALAAYYIIMPAEVASNLARYDGIRYGFQAKETVNLDEQFTNSRSQGFNSENIRRILIGNFVLSSGFYDAYYEKAQKVRTLIIKAFTEAFANVDVLLGATAPTTAFELGKKTSDPLTMYLEDIMTVAMSLAGVPALSLPIAQGQSMPFGIQITAAYKQDTRMLEAAKIIEDLR